MLNWTKLVAQGRAKDIGIPWSDAELIALTEHNIPAVYVRDGVLTPEAYVKALKQDETAKPISRANRDELEASAKEAGIEFASETPDSVLVTHVKKAKSKKQHA